VTAILRSQQIADAFGLRDPALGSMNGFAAWNGDPRYIQAGVVAVGGTLYVMPVWIAEPCTIDNLWVSVSTAGSTLTAAQNLISLYNAVGTKLADSADQSGVWVSTGTRAAAITPQVFTAAQLAYITLLSVGTTPASFSRISANAITSNANLLGAALQFATNGTGLSATPASISPPANSVTGAQGFWVAAN
jgi:hypothetical protein